MTLLLLACVTPASDYAASDSAASDDTSSTGDDTSSAADSGDSQDTDPQTDPNAPVISSCDAYCYLHQTGDQNYQWKIECSVDDPDGMDNVWNGRFDILFGTSTIADDKIACDDAGYCSGSFGETTHEVYCEQADSYEFVIFISDWDENESKPYRVTGRRG